MAISVKEPAVEEAANAEVVQEVVQEEVVQEEPKPAPVKKTSVNLGAVTFQDKSPCNWNIVEIEEGIVEARNTVTGEVFTGNLEDFNASLKG